MATPVAIQLLEQVENAFGRSKIVVTGTKITVHEIAEMVAHGGASVDWLLENFALTRAQIHAALAYYYEHQAQMDQEIEATNADVRRRATDAQTHLAEMRARKKSE